MRHAGRVMSRTLITEYAWGYHFDPGTNIVDVVINHLRKKVDAKHGNRLITTVRGVGYMIKDEKADARRDDKRDEKREEKREPGRGGGSHMRTPSGGGRDTKDH
jgi:DNA-binding winged helix-turn-helix (wHTH) protein